MRVGFNRRGGSSAARLLCSLVLFVASSGCSSEAATQDTPEAARDVGTVRAELGSFNVLTRAYDNRRSGTNLSESSLVQGNVNSSRFGKLFSMSVDDEVYAQPLYASSLAFPDGSTHSVLFVATVNNSVYAFDADTGVALWQASFNGTGRPPRNTEVANGGACGGSYQDFSGNIGIVGTPVIDGASQTLYFVTRTLESGAMSYRLHAVDVTTGSERMASRIIQATVTGSGDGADGAGHIVFNPMFHNQRAGLALASSTVYVSFASYCDKRPYHGWVMAYDATTLASTGAFATTPTGAQGGIWQAGAAPAIDDGGNVFVATGNGVGDDAVVNLGESLVKLSPRSLALVDYFTASNYANLDSEDGDFGSAGPVFMPSSDFLVQGGKEGRVYVLDSGSLGHLAAGDTQIPQVFQAVDTAARPTETHHIHNQVVPWSAPGGTSVYVWGENDYLRAYRYTGTGFTTPAFAVGAVLPPIGMPGGSIALSANGTGTASAGSGILWATTPSSGNANHGSVSGVLRAFNAENLALLWDSSSPGDDMGTLTKGSPPVIANGRVYVPSLSGKISVYGSRTGPTPPVLNAVYQIRTGTTSGECVDVAKASTADGANVQQYKCNGTNAQRWQVIDVSDNVYELRAVVSNKCLEVALGGTADLTNVQQNTCNGTNGQHWAIQFLGSGRYRLMPQTAPNKCLDVAHAGTTDGTNIDQYKCNGTSAQAFTLALDTSGTAPIPSATFRINTATGPGLCVDVRGGSTDDKAQVQQYPCNGTDAQRWRFRNISGNLYEVRAAVSNRCLDVSLAGTADGTNVWQAGCDGTPAETWSIESLGTGGYRFVPQSTTGKCMTVSTGDATSKANIQQSTCNGSAAQRFSVIAP